MMKSSMCTIGFQKNKWGRDRSVEIPLREILPILSEAGLDGVEIWIDHLAALDDKGREQALRQLQQLKLGVAMISPYFDFTTSDDSAADSLARARSALELARQFGSGGIRVFTGKTGSADATESQWQRAAQALQTLADESRDDPLIWACEVHSRNLTDTLDGCARLMALVNRPNVKLIYQPTTLKSHALTGVDVLAQHIGHVHAANSRNGKNVRLADGEIDYPALFARLQAIGFSGYVSIEWMGDNPQAVAIAEAAYLRQVLPK